MGVNSLPKTVTRQRRACDLNPGPSAPESSTLTTRLPSHVYVSLQVGRTNQRTGVTSVEQSVATGVSRQRAYRLMTAVIATIPRRIIIIIIIVTVSYQVDSDAVTGSQTLLQAGG